MTPVSCEDTEKLTFFRQKEGIFRSIWTECTFFPCLFLTRLEVLISVWDSSQISLLHLGFPHQIDPLILVLTIFFETIRKHPTLQLVAGILPATGCLILFEYRYCYNNQYSFRRLRTHAHSLCDRFRRDRTFQLGNYQSMYPYGTYSW